jgi:hypothetical protein
MTCELPTVCKVGRARRVIAARRVSPAYRVAGGSGGRRTWVAGRFGSRSVRRVEVVRAGEPSISERVSYASAPESLGWVFALGRSYRFTCGGTSLGGGHLLVHRHRGVDASVGGARG